MTYHTYLPMIASRSKQPFIGVQLEGQASNQVNWMGQDSFAVYRLYWSDEYQPERGILQWPSWVDDDMYALKPWPVLLNIKNSPTWARRDVDIECSGPTDPQDYANFVRAACERYHPWMISVWNEPDVSAKESKNAGLDHYLGGFGEEGAADYGALVMATYEVARNLGIPLVAGELMMKDAVFWEMAREYCRYDFVAFHAYSEWRSTWDEIGRKADLLKMGGDSYLICTETNYLWHENGSHEDTFDQDQADYLTYVFDTFKRPYIYALAIYAMRSGWRGADLIRDGQPLPSHNAYLAATTIS